MWFFCHGVKFVLCELDFLLPTVLPLSDLKMRVGIAINVFFASIFIPGVGGEYIQKEPENLTNVSCGNDLYAHNCSGCPFDMEGNYHGGFRCSGDCKWSNNGCKEKGINDNTPILKLPILYWWSCSIKEAFHLPHASLLEERIPGSLAYFLSHSVVLSTTVAL